LQCDDFLRLRGIVAQRDLAARTESLLLRLQAHFEIVFRNGESLTVQGGRRKTQAA
jgi:hypothetical protein